jgi:hypothetical protein
VRVRFDVASVLERGTGSVEVHNRLPLDSSVLSQLPAANGPVTLSHAAEALLNPWLGTHGGGGPQTGTGQPPITISQCQRSHRLRRSSERTGSWCVARG